MAGGGRQRRRVVLLACGFIGTPHTSGIAQLASIAHGVGFVTLLLALAAHKTARSRAVTGAYDDVTCGHHGGTHTVGGSRGMLRLGGAAIITDRLERLAVDDVEHGREPRAFGVSVFGCTGLTPRCLLVKYSVWLSNKRPYI